jgi:hypothetical protein
MLSPHDLYPVDLDYRFHPRWQAKEAQEGVPQAAGACSVRSPAAILIKGRSKSDAQASCAAEPEPSEPRQRKSLDADRPARKAAANDNLCRLVESDCSGEPESHNLQRYRSLESLTSRVCGHRVVRPNSIKLVRSCTHNDASRLQGGFADGLNGVLARIAHGALRAAAGKRGLALGSWGSPLR